MASLAQKIGLNVADYSKWLSAVGPSQMPASANTPINDCAQFQIPNTVVAYWAGNVDGFGRWWVRWNSSVRYLERRGFNVAEYYHEPGDEWRLRDLLRSEADYGKLHGLYFWGHGDYPYPAQGLWSASGDLLVEFSTIDLKYKMGLGLVFSCDSNSGKTALSSGTTGKVWKGFTGTLVPWPWLLYHPRWYLPPGAQGTRK